MGNEYIVVCSECKERYHCGQVVPLPFKKDLKQLIHQGYRADPKIDILRELYLFSLRHLMCHLTIIHNRNSPLYTLTTKWTPHSEDFAMMRCVFIIPRGSSL